MRLLMLKIGARPKGRLIEQHDVIFVVVDKFTQVIAMINAAWPAVKNTWHIDAWREVTRVGDYGIALTQGVVRVPSENKLFFVNLGGYLPDVFEEFHYKTLVVAPNASHAAAQAKQHDFYTTYNLTTKDALTGVNGVSHVDDKLAVDVDDMHCINDLIHDTALTIHALSALEKQTMPVDTLHIGYLSLRQIRDFFG